MCAGNDAMVLNGDRLAHLQISSNRTTRYRQVNAAAALETVSIRSRKAFCRLTTIVNL